MNILKSRFKDEEFVFSRGSDIKPIETYIGYFLRTDITVATPAALTFVSSTDVDTSSDEISEPSHGYLTGLVGQMTTDGTLPTGLSLATDYYIIKVDSDTYKLASSLQNAKDSVAIDLTGTGSGNQTFTPLTMAGGFIKIQGSHLESPTLETDWEDVLSIEPISATGVKSWNVTGAFYHKMRYYVILDSGQIDIVANFNGKG